MRLIIPEKVGERIIEGPLMDTLDNPFCGRGDPRIYTAARWFNLGFGVRLELTNEEWTAIMERMAK